MTVGINHHLDQSWGVLRGLFISSSERILRSIDEIIDRYNQIIER